MKIVFFELEPWEIDYMRPKIIGHDVELYETKASETNSDSMYSADIIATFIFSRFPKEVLDKFPNLKLIATMSTGFDHIDLEECKRRNIVVCNVPSYGENTVAEHAFGLILNLSRNIHKAFVRTQIDDKFDYTGLMGFDLKGKTLGVVGTGRIGCNSIKMAKGFDMKVIAYDEFQRPELQGQLGFTYVSFDELLKNSDIITIHVPLLKSTYHLIDDVAINKMKRGALIINTARGPIIDTPALIKGLQNGQIGGAGLDVLEGELLVKDDREIYHNMSKLPREQIEQLLQDHELMNMSNVIVTPHLAFYSREGVQRIMDQTLKNIFDLIEHRGFTNRVA